jgi:hypothetical protein
MQRIVISRIELLEKSESTTIDLSLIQRPEKDLMRNGALERKITRRSGSKTRATNKSSTEPSTRRAAERKMGKKGTPSL